MCPDDYVTHIQQLIISHIASTQVLVMLCKLSVAYLCHWLFHSNSYIDMFLFVAWYVKHMRWQLMYVAES